MYPALEQEVIALFGKIGTKGSELRELYSLKLERSGMPELNVTTVNKIG